MDAFASLVKERRKAMNVFVKARDRLVGVLGRLAAEEVKAEEKIAEEKEKVEWLASEYKSVDEQLTKIRAITG